MSGAAAGAYHASASTPRAGDSRWAVRFAVRARNSHAFAALHFGLARLGAVLVPINFMPTPDEAVFSLCHSRARLLAADSERAPWRPARAARFPFLSFGPGLPGFPALISCPPARSALRPVLQTPASCGRSREAPTRQGDIRTRACAGAAGQGCEPGCLGLLSDGVFTNLARHWEAPALSAKSPANRPSASRGGTEGALAHPSRAARGAGRGSPGGPPYLRPAGTETGIYFGSRWRS